MSRQATDRSDVFPPWAFRNTSLRAGVVATQVAMSSRTLSIVSELNQRVPGDQACSLDLDTARVGSSQRSTSSPTAVSSAEATSSAMTASTDRGRWGPCCSMAPTGSSTTESVPIASVMVGPDRSARRPDMRQP